MPVATPVSETSLTATVISEASPVATALAEVGLTATGVSEQLALPGLYPSATTYPSAAGTYPSLGTAGVFVTPSAEGALTATVLTEI